MRHSLPPAGALLVLLMVMLITFGTAALVTLSVGFAVFGALFSPVVPVLIGLALIHLVAGSRHRRRRRALRRGVARPPIQPGPPPWVPQVAPRPVRPDIAWAHTRTRFHTLRDAYAAHECDTLAVLRLPALSDVSVPSTSRFVDAFAEAQALETDHLPPPQHAAAFAHAVDKAERAWRAARDAAERIRLSALTPEERHTIERVVKLLTTARDSDSDPERHAAYVLARTELDKLDRAGVVHVPRAARAAIDTAARGSLPA
ncbi:MAG: hypothetical protein L0H84_00370 [Pseudonocardia sp.]|nr:hypothetical protein [Pseudonocardia sp.]